MKTIIKQGELWTDKVAISTTQTYTSIFNTYYQDNRSEFTILASDLFQLGLVAEDVLTELCLKPTVLPGRDLKNVNIGLKHTNTAELNQLDAWETYTQVYVNPLLDKANIVANQWFSFSLLPFVWNGKDHLKVTLIRDDTTYTSGGEWQSRQSVGENRYIGFKSDSYFPFPFDGGTLSETGNDAPSLYLVASSVHKDTWEKPQKKTESNWQEGIRKEATTWNMPNAKRVVLLDKKEHDEIRSQLPEDQRR